MHEMALMESVLDLVTKAAHGQGFKRIMVLRLEIGELSSVDLQSLRFAFDAINGHTCAAGAKLEIVTVPGQAHCMDCGRPVRIRQRLDPCPLCGGGRLQVTGGEEMRVKDMEVD